jgi:hypothetical protein
MIPTPLNPMSPPWSTGVQKCYVKPRSGLRLPASHRRVADAGKLDPLAREQIEMSDKLPDEDAVVKQPGRAPAKRGR